MSRRSEIENVLNVKTALTEKYERLAQHMHSKPRKKRLLNQARAYRQQAAELASELKQWNVAR